MEVMKAMALTVSPPSQLHLPSLHLTLPTFGQVIVYKSLYLFASLCYHIDVPFAWTALPRFLLAVKSPFTVSVSSCSPQLWAPQRLPVEVPPPMRPHWGTFVLPAAVPWGVFSKWDYTSMPRRASTDARIELDQGLHTFLSCIPLNNFEKDIFSVKIMSYKLLSSNSNKYTGRMNKWVVTSDSK